MPKHGALGRREFLYLSTAAAAGSLLGCTAPTDASQDAELVFWNYWPEGESKFKAILGAFEKQNPQVKVKYELLPWDQYWQKLNATLVTGNPPDVWYTAPTYYFEYVERRQLLHLDPYIEGDNEISIEDWLPQPIDQWRVGPDGKLFGLPSGFVAQVVFYNKDLFDEAGVEYPAENWTWDDFLEMAKALTKRDSSGKTEVWGCTAPNWLPHVDQIIESNGGMVIDEKQTKCMLDANSSAAETIQFMADLIHKHKVAPPTDAFEGMGDPFTTGRIAMHFNLQIGAIAARDAGFNWSNQLIPRGQVKSLNYGGSDGFVISSPTKYPREAYELVKFLTSMAGPTLYIGTGIIPVRKDLAKNADYLKQPPPPDDYGVWTKAVEHSTHNFGPGYSEWQDAKNNPLEAVYLGKISAEQGVKEACQAMDAALEKIQG